jgi:hypothetical protein
MPLVQVHTIRGVFTYEACRPSLHRACKPFRNLEGLCGLARTQRGASKSAFRQQARP